MQTLLGSVLSLFRANRHRGRDRDQSLFFSDAVAAYVENPRFIRRSWLEEEVNRHLKDPEARFVLIVGEPGAGKSTLLAQLADENPRYPVYFVRRDQRSLLGGLSAHSLLTQVGYQLAHLYPEVFDTEELQVSVTQSIDTATGSIVGLDVDKLITSPFYRTVALIKQRVGRSSAGVTGLRVRELIADPQQVPLGELQFMALINPAMTLLRQRPRERIVLLIDALDELSGRDVGGTIVEWLTNCPELPQNVRIVMTSRPPDAALQALCLRHESRLRELHMRSTDDRMIRDLRAYADDLVRSAPIADYLSHRKRSRRDFVRKLLSLSEGNIGYLDAFARAVDHANATADDEQTKELLSLKSAPKSLSGIHRFLVAQLMARASTIKVDVSDKDGNKHYVDAWSAVHSRLMSVLAVVREPVPLRQLQRLAGVEANPSPGYQDLAPLLEEMDGSYQFYHSSLAESLLCPPDVMASTSEFCVEPLEWNARIADRYLRDLDGEWSRFDDYGVRNVIAHTIHAGRIDELDSVMNHGWLAARSQREDFTFGGCLTDVALAREHLSVTSAADVPALIRLHMVARIIRDSVSQHTDTELRTLAWLGHLSPALALARTRPTAQGVVEGLLAIYHVTRSRGEPRFDLIDEAFGAARHFKPSPAEEHTLQRITWAYAQSRRFEAAEEAMELIDKSYRRALALKYIASAHMQAGDLVSAEQTIDRIPDGESKAAALRLLAEEHIRSGSPRSKHHVSRAAAATDCLDSARDYALRYLASMLAKVGWQDDAVATLADISDPDELVSAISAVLDYGRSEAPRLCELLREAHARAVTGYDGLKQEMFLERLVRAFVAAGCLDEALEIVKEVESTKQSQLRVRAYLAARDATSAEELASEVTDEYAKLQLLCDVATADLEPGEHDKAMHRVQTAIAGAAVRKRGYAAQRIAQFLIDEKRLASARQMCGFITKDEERSRTLENLAEALAENGDATALDVLAEVRQTRDESGHTTDAAAVALTRLVHALADFDREKARPAIPLALQAWEDQHDTGEGVRMLLTSLLRVDQHELASDVIRHAERWRIDGDLLHEYLRCLVRVGQGDQAVGFANQTLFGHDRDHALRAIGSEFAERHSFEEAEAAARNIEECWIRIETFRSIALNAVECDIAYAEHVARSLTEDFGKTLILVYLKSGRLEDAVTQAESVDFDLEQIEAFCAVGAALVKVDAQRGLELLEHARSMADTLDELRPSYWHAVVKSLVEASCFEEAIAAIDLEEGVKEREQASVDVVRGLAMSGEVERAVSMALAIGSTFERDKAVKSIMEILICNREIQVAWDLADSLDDGLTRTEMLVLVARALVAGGRLGEARGILSIHGDRMSAECEFRELAKAYAAAGRIDDALAAVPIENAEELMGYVADCSPAFELAQPGTGLAMLKYSIDVLCWKYPRWRRVREALFGSIS